MRTLSLYCALATAALSLAACGDDRALIPPPNPAVAVPPPSDLAAPPDAYQPPNAVERRLPSDE
jgi:hypothetical protein